MKRNVLLCVLALCVSMLVLFSFLIFGCGTNPTSGGGGGGGVGALWIYCGNNTDQTISIIEGATNTVTGSIEVPGDPTWLAAAPDGKHIYCLAGTTNDVYAINTATNTLETVYSVSGTCGPYDNAAVSADNNFLYVVRYGATDLFKLNLVTGTEESVSVPNNPYYLALSADRKTAYIPVWGNQVQVVSLETLSMHSISAQTDQPSEWEIAAAVQNNKLYMTLQGAKECLEIDLASEIVTNVLTTDASTLMGIVSIPGTNTLYASNAEYAGEIRIIDSNTPTFESTKITGDSSFKGPANMAVTDDGSKVYVFDWSKSQGQVVMISTIARTIEAYIPVGNCGGSGYKIHNPVVIYK